MDIAKSNTTEGFIKGRYPVAINTTELIVCSAASAFGKFQKQFLSELHAEIVSHAKNEEAGLPAQPVQGITVHDSDVLEPEPVRQGGLMRSDAVRLHVTMKDGSTRIYIYLYPETCV